jgi:8-oxo-dGTP pyrophosphatase MutT (NUDIX family)
MPITKIDKKILHVLVTAGCLIEKDGKYLLVQEKKKEAFGLWNFPAGKVEIGDTFKETAEREAKEETGYQVETVSKVGIYNKDGDKSVKHVFEGKIIGGKLDFPKDEILDTGWYSFEEIIELNKSEKLRSDWIVSAIEDYLSKQKTKSSINKR